MRKILYLFFVCFVASLSFLMISKSVNAASTDAYLIMTNPAEDSNSSMTITWHTLIEGTFVEYTTKDDTDFSEAQKENGIYESLTIYDGTTGSNISDYKCYVTIKDLASDTEYIYRVGKNNMSEVHKFKTGGTEAFNFAVVSDIHVYTKISSRLSKAASIIDGMNQKANLNFVLSVGDTMAYGTNRGYWSDLCDSSIIKNYMFAATPGNHDYYNSSASFLDSSYFNAYTKNPNNGPEGMENTTYYFFYNNIMFISLNSEDACTNSSKRQLQRTWLEEVLENNTANFIVVYFHRSMYPGSGSNQGHATTMKNAYQDLFDKYGVDLVFGGHDHVYVRTGKILNGTASPNSMFGTTYISLLQIGDRASSANSDMTNIAKKVGSASGGVLFKATKDSLSFELIDDTGAVLDGGIIPSKMSLLDTKKLDRYTKIDYEDNFSNMKLNIYDGLFQKAINVKVYDGENVILDFRPEFNKTEYDISGVSDITRRKEYKIEITYRDGTTYEKEVIIENKDLKITYSHENITCFIEDEIELNVSNNLNLDLEYTYEVDSDYIEIKDGKMYAKKVGNTTIKVFESEEEVLEIAVLIKEIPVYYATLNLNGGSISSQDNKIKVDDLGNLENPIREGYTFIGWFLDAEYTIEYQLADFEEDIDLYAKWEKIEVIEDTGGCNSAAIFYYSLLLLGVFIFRRKSL